MPRASFGKRTDNPQLEPSAEGVETALARTRIETSARPNRIASLLEVNTANDSPIIFSFVNRQRHSVPRLLNILY